MQSANRLGDGRHTRASSPRPRHGDIDSRKAQADPRRPGTHWKVDIRRTTGQRLPPGCGVQGRPRAGSVHTPPHG